MDLWLFRTLPPCFYSYFGICVLDTDGLARFLFYSPYWSSKDKFIFFCLPPQQEGQTVGSATQLLPWSCRPSVSRSRTSLSFWPQKHNIQPETRSLDIFSILITFMVWNHAYYASCLIAHGQAAADYDFYLYIEWALQIQGEWLTFIGCTSVAAVWCLSKWMGLNWPINEDSNGWA